MVPLDLPGERKEKNWEWLWEKKRVKKNARGNQGEKYQLQLLRNYPSGFSVMVGKKKSWRERGSRKKKNNFAGAEGMAGSGEGPAGGSK